MSLGRLDLVFVLSGLLALISIASGDDPQSPAVMNKQMEKWWVDLAKYEPEASHALLKFAFKLEKTVPFFKEKMKPLKIEKEEVRALLLKLGSDQDEIWKPAFEQLEYFDPRLAIDLETLMGEVKDKRTRTRMVAILSGHPTVHEDGKEIVLRSLGNGEGFNFFDGQGSWWAEHQVGRLRAENGWGNPKVTWIRAIRAINLLDQIGTADALEILRTMATGHPDAEPTLLAKARLKAREAIKP